jgi:polyhydroxyalkanoate synthesis regulator protein
MKKNKYVAIVKYANRKLYDREKHRYTTLEELFGEAFSTSNPFKIPTVVDQKTGADVTEALLAQYAAKLISDGSHAVARGYFLASLVPLKKVA